LQKTARTHLRRALNFINIQKFEHEPHEQTQISALKALNLPFFSYSISNRAGNPGEVPVIETAFCEVCVNQAAFSRVISKKKDDAPCSHGSY
jgi:hypothetical protein